MRAAASHHALAPAAARVFVADVHASEENAFDGRFERMAAWLLARGVRPNHLTVAQLPVFAAEIWAALAGHPWIFVGLIVFVIFLDGMDGILARVGGLQSHAGALLDASFDTVGIAIVLWGAGRFNPEAEMIYYALFGGNLLLYVQNQFLDEKMVSYVRGPVLASVVFPDTLLLALFIPSFILVWLMVARLPRTFQKAGNSLPS